MQADILIVGAGPAGAALAATLAPRWRVVVLDKLAQPGPRIGESLVPAAGRLLRDMGLLSAFKAEGFAPYLGNRSYWGGAAAQVTDFLRDPDGAGWHLERARFERFLRAAAVARGARILAPVKLGAVTRVGAEWRLDATPGLRLGARLLVDAGGRSAALAKRLGAVRHNSDRTVAHWLRGSDCAAAPDAGFSTVESAPGGWWYTAPLQSERVLAYHTDPDLGAPADLLAAANRLPGIGPLLAGFRPDAKPATVAANSARLEPFAGAGWLAIGDAAQSFDPLASRGLFQAMYSAFSGAAACAAALEGDTRAFADYADDQARIAETYMRHVRVFYGSETRWCDSPFWQRRIALAAAP